MSASWHSKYDDNEEEDDDENILTDFQEVATIATIATIIQLIGLTWENVFFHDIEFGETDHLITLLL